jgi:hypothetical protein
VIDSSREHFIVAGSRAIAVVDRRNLVKEAIQNAARLLPPHVAGAPFTYQNPLRAFEALDFDTAVSTAARLYGAEPFLSEEAYHEALAKSQFLLEDIEAISAREANTAICGDRLDRISLRRAMSAHAPRRFDARTIEWMIEESDLLRRPETKALFDAVSLRVAPSTADPQTYGRPRDGILASDGIDLDDIVLPFVVRAAERLYRHWSEAAYARTRARLSGRDAHAAC